MFLQITSSSRAFTFLPFYARFRGLTCTAEQVRNKIAGCAVFVGKPAVVIILMAVIATPFLGLVIIAFISSRFDSRSK